MLLINHSNFIAYFGNADDALCDPGQSDYAHERFVTLQKKLSLYHQPPLNGLCFLKQTHSADVFLLPKNAQPSIDIFNQTGDAIITQAKNIGIGVVTADCLPLFLYDAQHQAIGVIHAGWRGLAKKIITATITEMRAAFNTRSDALRVYLGPSASVCCYEVQPDFLTHFSAPGLIELRQENYYFNVRKAAIFELSNNGVMQHNIHTDHNDCTMCHPGFCSYRQQKEHAGRQASIIFLKAAIVI